MSWLPWSSDSGKRGEEKKSSMSWIDSINATDWEQYKDPKLWIHSILLTATGIASIHFYRSYLRRLPGTLHIEPARFRKRSLFGKVTSVGDGDNFHLFHTPGGRLAGWGWARKVPTSRLELKGRTVMSLCQFNLRDDFTNVLDRYPFESLALMLQKQRISGGQHSPSPEKPSRGYLITSLIGECEPTSTSAISMIESWAQFSCGDSSSRETSASRC